MERETESLQRHSPRLTSIPQCYRPGSELVGNGKESSANVSATQSELISPVTVVRAADGKIAPRKSKPSSGAAGLQSPPVTYMHICETEVFSMGVFLLWPGASISLHVHPDMNGDLRSC